MTIITWDWKEQPDWTAFNAALSKVSSPIIIPVFTNSDEYAAVVADAGTTEHDAQAFYANRQWD